MSVANGMYRVMPTVSDVGGYDMNRLPDSHAAKPVAKPEGHTHAPFAALLTRGFQTRFFQSEAAMIESIRPHAPARKFRYCETARQYVEIAPTPIAP